MEHIFNSADTICAVATAPGVGGIAVIRVSGSDAITIVDSLWRGKSLESCSSHTAHLGTIVTPDGEPIDQAVATIYRAPNSFTGDNVVELSVHGSIYVQQRLIEILIEAGCRLAEPGEFSRRAFSAGKMDLAATEAVADLIASKNKAAHRMALSQMTGKMSARLNELRNRLIHLGSLLELELDFSEEDVEFASRSELSTLARQITKEISTLLATFRAGTAIREGIPIAIVGPTNAGKSSLLNALLGDDRAIVSDIHGTTRDTVDATLTIGDYLIRLTDTAGIRDTDDPIEAIGIARSHDAATKAMVIIYTIDSTACNSSSQQEVQAALDNLRSNAPDATIILAHNKTDLRDANAVEFYLDIASDIQQIPISARTGQGLEILKKAIVESISPDTLPDVMISNTRHATALSQAADALTSLTEAIDAEIPTVFAAQHLRQAIHHLASITGDITTPDILESIFSRFCVGK